MQLSLLKLHFDPFLELGNKMENLRVEVEDEGKLTAHSKDDDMSKY